MINADNARKVFFYAFASLVLFAAVFHFTGIFYKVNDAPIWRHILFVFIDLFSVYGLLKRPKYFFYFFLFLTMQQYYTHGNQLITIWAIEHKIDWASLLILFLFPIGLWFLYVEGKLIARRELNNPKRPKE